MALTETRLRRDQRTLRLWRRLARDTNCFHVPAQAEAEAGDDCNSRELHRSARWLQAVMREDPNDDVWNDACLSG